MLEEIRLRNLIFIYVYMKEHPMILNDAVKIVKKGLGMPSFVNDQVIIPSLLHREYYQKTLSIILQWAVQRFKCRENGAIERMERVKLIYCVFFEIVLDGGIDRKSGKIMDGLTPLKNVRPLNKSKMAIRKQLNII